MKFRKLQQLNEKEQWEDHGYAYERDDGRASFRYNNLVWGQIGARYNVQLREAKTKLEDVPQVIPATKRLRWLEIEEFDGDLEDIKADLDKACKMPWLQRVSTVKPVVA
jgi:hypothetical protein